MEKTSLVGAAGAQVSKLVETGVGLCQACLDQSDGDEFVFVDGHDDAILGLAEVDGDWRVVYDRAAIIHKLVQRDGMDRDGASDFFCYNVAGAFFSAAPPLFLNKLCTQIPH